MSRKTTAWSAYRAGKLRLPPGYELERDADVLHLLRHDGSTVAVFSVRGVNPTEVEKTAEEDYRGSGNNCA